MAQWRRVTALAALAAAAAALWVWQGAPARRQARAEALLRVVLPVVRFDNAPFADAIASLQKQTGADLVIAPGLSAYAAGQPVDLTLRNVTLEQVLNALAGYIQPAAPGEVFHYIHDGRIVASTDPVGHRPFVRVYDIRDLYADLPEPEPAVDRPRPTDGGGSLFIDVSTDATWTRAAFEEELARLLMETCRPDGWYDAGGNRAAMTHIPGRFLVLADAETHEQLADMLEQLRARPPAREERP